MSYSCLFIQQTVTQHMQCLGHKIENQVNDQDKNFKRSYQLGKTYWRVIWSINHTLLELKRNLVGKKKNNLFQSNLTAVKTPSPSAFPIAGSKLSEHTASSVVGGLWKQEIGFSCIQLEFISEQLPPICLASILWRQIRSMSLLKCGAQKVTQDSKCGLI